MDEPAEKIVVRKPVSFDPPLLVLHSAVRGILPAQQGDFFKRRVRFTDAEDMRKLAEALDLVHEDLGESAEEI